MNQPGFEQGPLPTLPPSPPPRSSAPIVIAAIAGLVVGGALTAIAMVLLRSPAPAPAPVASASAKPGPRPSASASAAPPELTLEQRAAKGDKDAVAELQKMPREQRTAEQDLALASARRVAKEKQIDELGRKIKLVQKLGRDRATKKKIEGLADDREVGNDMLATLAKLPGPVGPDLLYTVWAHTHRTTDTTELAEQLLYSKDVRPKASEALQLALDLRNETDCAKMAKLLERAKDKGDRRSQVPIVHLNAKHGCGPKKLADCWSCLRKTTLVKDAFKEVSRRSPP
jgi:hypothetical protein